MKKIKLLLIITLLVVLSRAGLYVTAYLGNNIFADYTIVPAYQTWQIGEKTETRLSLPLAVKETHWPTWADFCKHNANLYMSMAVLGYEKGNFYEDHPPANWAFFPLYPLLLAAVHKFLLLCSYPIAGIILSNLCLIVSLYFLYLIARIKKFSENESKLVLILILIYPASLYFSVPYPESLFLLLSSGTVFYTLKNDFRQAFLFAGLSSVTAIPGFLNILYVLAYGLAGDLKNTGKRGRQLLVPFGLSLLPLSLFFGYMQILTGNFFAPLAEQISWAGKPSVPLISYIRYLFNPYFIAPGGWDSGIISFLVITIVLMIYMVKLFRDKLWQERNELLFFIYGFMFLLIPFFGSQTGFTGIIRYLMVSVPVYFYLVELTRKNEYLKYFYLLVMASLNILMIVAYINDYYFVI